MCGLLASEGVEGRAGKSLQRVNPGYQQGHSSNTHCQLKKGFASGRGIDADLADNSLDGVECTAYHPGSRGGADIVSVTMPR